MCQFNQQGPQYMDCFQSNCSSSIKYVIPAVRGILHTDGTYKTKDSGKRQEFSTGMVRDIQTDKPRYDLVDWPMIQRWAELMQRGALKYGEHNWKKAETQLEFERFRASALRHMVQWFAGETDEDHAAACYFNLAGAEMVKTKMLQKDKPLAF